MFGLCRKQMYKYSSTTLLAATLVSFRSVWIYFSIWNYTITNSFMSASMAKWSIPSDLLLVHNVVCFLRLKFYVRRPQIKPQFQAVVHKSLCMHKCNRVWFDFSMELKTVPDSQWHELFRMIFSREMTNVARYLFPSITCLWAGMCKSYSTSF